MIYGSWDMNCDRIFVILGHFLAFYPLTTQKIKILKKKKKILHKCTKTHDHMLYCSWDMVHDRCNLHFSFWTIFCPEKPKLKKKKWKKKLPGDIIILHVYQKTWPKPMIIQWMITEIWCATVGWMDGQTEKVTYKVGTPTKKLNKVGAKGFTRKQRL